MPATTAAGGASDSVDHPEPYYQSLRVPPEDTHHCTRYTAYLRGRVSGPANVPLRTDARHLVRLSRRPEPLVPRLGGVRTPHSRLAKSGSRGRESASDSGM